MPRLTKNGPVCGQGPLPSVAPWERALPAAARSPPSPAELADGVYALARVDVHQPRAPCALARRILGRTGLKVARQEAIQAQSALAFLRGRMVIFVAHDVLPAQTERAVAHELGELILRLSCPALPSVQRQKTADRVADELLARLDHHHPAPYRRRSF
jgi:hypothetical protein